MYLYVTGCHTHKNKEYFDSLKSSWPPFVVIAPAEGSSLESCTTLYGTINRSYKEGLTEVIRKD
jgi:hypothetical protein